MVLFAFKNREIAPRWQTASGFRGPSHVAQNRDAATKYQLNDEE